MQQNHSTQTEEQKRIVNQLQERNHVLVKKIRELQVESETKDQRIQSLQDDLNRKMP